MREVVYIPRPPPKGKAKKGDMEEETKTCKSVKFQRQNPIFQFL